MPIINMPAGIDTSDATATAEHILAGMTAYGHGMKITGTAGAPLKAASGSAGAGSSITINCGFLAHTIILLYKNSSGNYVMSFIYGGTGTNFEARFSVVWYGTNTANEPVITARNQSYTQLSLNPAANTAISWYAVGN